MTTTTTSPPDPDDPAILSAFAATPDATKLYRFHVEQPADRNLGAEVEQVLREHSGILRRLEALERQTQLAEQVAERDATIKRLAEEHYRALDERDEAQRLVDAHSRRLLRKSAQMEQLVTDVELWRDRARRARERIDALNLFGNARAIELHDARHGTHAHSFRTCPQGSCREAREFLGGWGEGTGPVPILGEEDWS